MMRWGVRRGIRLPTVSMDIILVAAMVFFATAPLQAQTLTVLHAFTGEGDNAAPASGLIIDRGGHLYGTTSALAGSVFKMADQNSGWVFTVLHNFDYENNRGGLFPNGKLTFGPDGNLYGVTSGGGPGNCPVNAGCGLVFKLQPPATFCPTFSCPWNETVLYTFTGGSDGGSPIGEIAFDSAGNIYGATSYGGDPSCNYGCGVVFKLTPSGSGWTQTVIHSFGPASGTDGIAPSGGVVVDAAGNVFGLTGSGGVANQGIVYELSPNNGSWSETILHNFQNLGQFVSPIGTLARDPSGNLYGLTSGDYFDGSHVFELSQPGTWTYSEIWHWGPERTASPDLAISTSGNLYLAVNATSGSDLGIVYELQQTNGTWNLIMLHSFVQSEGFNVNGGLVFDAAGNIYGTTSIGGDLNCPDGYGSGCGTVWEITP